MDTEGKTCYLSLTNGMEGTSAVDALVNHVDYDLIDGIEVEGSAWLSANWTYLRDQLNTKDGGVKLFAYQQQYLNPGSFPNAAVWPARSRLWYPFYIGGSNVDGSKHSYGPDDTGLNSTNITGATQANPVVVTANSHGFSNGATVTIRNVVGMTEINDRQFTVANANANDFELEGEDGTGHTAYTSGGTVSTHEEGRPKQIARRHDASLYPPGQQAAYRHADYDNRKIHMWLQAFGQPMTENDWDDNYGSWAQPGVGHFFAWLWLAHIAGCRKVSFFTYRISRYVNRHKDTTNSGSPINYVSDMDRNTSTTLSAEEVGRYERTWTRIKNAVAAYKAGPGTFPNNTDGDFGVENPYVGVVPFGQSLSRLDSSTA